MNPLAFLQIKSAWDKFQANHPKFPKFIDAVSKDGLSEGTIIEIKVSTPEGRNFHSNLKVKQDDLELLEEIKKFSKN